ncbi:hypothetical protein [Leptospira weilii]|uniref:hypothetical protein n=1 Tax=Leptospira weilii TaxID=28184 RepID=UPI0007746B9E|nr:hypothetical protein [Leptospira weilii]
MLFVSEKFLSVLENSGVDNFIATPLHYKLRSTQEIRTDFWAMIIAGSLTRGLVREQNAFGLLSPNNMRIETNCFHESVKAALEKLELPYLFFDKEFTTTGCAAQKMQHTEEFHERVLTRLQKAFVEQGCGASSMYDDGIRFMMYLWEEFTDPTFDQAGDDLSKRRARPFSH